MKKWLQYLKAPFTETDGIKWGFRLLFSVIFLTLISYEVYLFQHRGIKAMLLVISLTAVVIPGGFFLLTHIYDQIKKLPSTVVFYVGGSFVMLSFIFTSYKSEIGNYIAIGSTLVFLFLTGLFIYSIIHLFKNKNRYFKTIWVRSLFHLFYLISIVLMGYIYVYDGLPAEPITNAMDTFVVDHPIYEIPKGYDITQGIYGNIDYLNRFDFDEEFQSETTSVSYFLGAWGKSRAQFLGYNVFDIPLNGQFYMPEGKGAFPVVLVVHGNHEMTLSSETGYDYLGKYLAQRGFFVVSVDENCFNYSTYDSEFLDDSLGNENDARAYVLLSHLRYLEKLNQNQDSYFYQKLDFENIALMGHSRGGEAVAISEYFNSIQTLPNDSRKHLGMNYNIKSIVAIAPTDGQFQPANRYIDLENVNYLLLHGSNDMDVSYMTGNNQYERLSLTEPGYFKSAVWIYGANHGYFNETWYPYDTSPIGGKTHNIASLLERDTQEEIASQLISYFLTSTLKDVDYEVGFKNIANFVDLPETLYLTQYNNGMEEVIANFSEDDVLESATMDSVYISSSGLTKWYEGTSKLKGRKSLIYGAYLDTEGYYEGILKFTKDDFYTLTNQDAIYLTLGDMTEGNKELTELFVRLTDIYGKTSELNIGSIGLLQHYFEVILTKFPWFEDTNRSETHFQSYELPLQFFSNQDIEWTQIKSIAIVVPKDYKRKLFIKEIGIRHSR
ncbi:MAG: hypothetical protein JXR88_16115 [Clostridia bacterium]|nr:hypothetical protein [Clostridia bacterium]